MNLSNNFFLTQPVEFQTGPSNKSIFYYLEVNNVKHKLKEGINIIGRENDCDIQVCDGSLSKKHAMIEVANEGSVFIQDLSSMNKTFRNRLQLRNNVMYELLNGNELKFGLVSAKFFILPNIPTSNENNLNISSESVDLFSNNDGDVDRLSSNNEENSNDIQQDSLTKKSPSKFRDFFIKNAYNNEKTEEINTGLSAGHLDDTDILENAENNSITLDSRSIYTSTPAKKSKGDSTLIKNSCELLNDESSINIRPEFPSKNSSNNKVDNILDIENSCTDDSESNSHCQKQKLENENLKKSILHTSYNDDEESSENKQLNKEFDVQKSESVDMFHESETEDNDLFSETENEDDNSDDNQNTTQKISSQIKNLTLTNSDQELLALHFSEDSNRKNENHQNDEIVKSMFNENCWNSEEQIIENSINNKTLKENTEIIEIPNTNQIEFENCKEKEEIERNLVNLGKELEKEKINPDNKEEIIDNPTQLIANSPSYETDSDDNLIYDLPTQKLDGNFDMEKELISTQIITETNNNNLFSEAQFTQLATQTLLENSKSNTSPFIKPKEIGKSPLTIKENNEKTENLLKKSNNKTNRKSLANNCEKFESKHVEKILEKKSLKNSNKIRISKENEENLPPLINSCSSNSNFHNKIDNFTSKIESNRFSIFNFQCENDDLIENITENFTKNIEKNPIKKEKEKRIKIIRKKNNSEKIKNETELKKTNKQLKISTEKILNNKEEKKINEKVSMNFEVENYKFSMKYSCRQTATSQNAILAAVGNFNENKSFSTNRKSDEENDKINSNSIDSNELQQQQQQIDFIQPTRTVYKRKTKPLINHPVDIDENEIVENISKLRNCRKSKPVYNENLKTKENPKKLSIKRRKRNSSTEKSNQTKPDDSNSDNFNNQHEIPKKKRRRGRPKKTNFNSTKTACKSLNEISKIENETKSRQKKSKSEEIIKIKTNLLNQSDIENLEMEINEKKLRNSKERFNGKEMVINEEAQCPSLMFTGLTDCKYEKIVIKLGGKIVDNISDVDCLITDQIRRTVKFLCCLARGVPIVTTDWLISSQKAKGFVDTTPFIVKINADSFKINLGKSIALARGYQDMSGGIMAYYQCTVYVAGDTTPNPSQLEQIISYAGGKMIIIQDISFYDRLNDFESTHICIAEPEIMKTRDPDLIKRFNVLREKHIDILSVEFILTMIMEQKWPSQENYRIAP